MVNFDNFEIIQFVLENVELVPIAKEDVISVDLNDYDFVLEGKRYSKLEIKIKSDAKALEGFKPLNASTPVRRLYICDDISNIELIKGDEIKKINVAWTNWNVDEYNLYQKSFYEVNDNDNFTGAFIVRLFIVK